MTIERYLVGIDIGTTGAKTLIFDLDGQRAIFIVGFLDHSRDPDEVDLAWQGETAGKGRSGKDQDICIGSP